MKKSLFFIVIFLSAVQFSCSQEKVKKGHTAEQLVKVLYAKEVKQRVGFILEMKQQDTLEVINKEASFDEVIQKIATLYKTNYALKELHALDIFYASSLGKKILINRKATLQKVSEIIMNWEEKQQGINMEDSLLDMAPVIDEKSLEKIDSIAVLNTKITSLPEKPYPKIKTLDDLKKILLKDPFIISDTRVLKEILGNEVDIDKLMNPGMEELENEIIKLEKQ